jgi:hypothetical protein
MRGKLATGKVAALVPAASPLLATPGRGKASEGHKRPHECPDHRDALSVNLSGDKAYPVFLRLASRHECLRHLPGIPASAELFGTIKSSNSLSIQLRSLAASLHPKKCAPDEWRSLK